VSRYAQGVFHLEVEAVLGTSQERARLHILAGHLIEWRQGLCSCCTGIFVGACLRKDKGTLPGR
jgi:hypothetical protein